MAYPFGFLENVVQGEPSCPAAYVKGKTRSTAHDTGDLDNVKTARPITHDLFHVASHPIPGDDGIDCAGIQDHLNLSGTGRTANSHPPEDNGNLELNSHIYASSAPN